MTAYQIGVFFGILIGIGVWLIVRSRRKKRHPQSDEFDERQKIGRGKAFQAGFYTTLAAGGGVSILSYLELLPGNALPWSVGALLLGVCVFAVTAIRWDAYISFKENAAHYYIMAVCFIISMLCFGIPNLCSGDAHRIVFGILNLEVLAVWAAILVALLLRRASAGEEE